MATSQTTVAIIGAGPAGLFLGHLLAECGIDSVILERQDRDYVEHRVRAGVLEYGTVNQLVEHGVGERLVAEGLVHRGVELRFDGVGHRIDFPELTDGRTITVYGQQEVVKDLIASRIDQGAPLEFGSTVVSVEGIEGSKPIVHYVNNDEHYSLTCDIVVGCDGFHGVTRTVIPDDRQAAFDQAYPFAWLGILAAVKPSSEELIYCRHERGFALHSMRSPSVTRLYLQVDPNESIDNWSDDRIWSELQARFSTTDGWTLSDGPVIEKSITAMRSVVVEPMRYGSLFLAGDAAHIVPPTGAKGMNLAMADARTLASALQSYFQRGDEVGLSEYSGIALRRAWRAQEFSTFMTMMLHPQRNKDFENRVQEARLRLVVSSRGASQMLAENYVDLSSST